MADDAFTVTSLRFSTACGMSERLRLDLVLNDFVAGAIVDKKITILSDGSPWRPLIHIRDMARAIDWAATRQADNGGNFVAVNVGSNAWNYQIKDLAVAVSDVIGGIDISINTNASPDKRSYKVNFDYFTKLAPNYLPQMTLEKTVSELQAGLLEMNFAETNFRDTWYMRLKALKEHLDNGRLNPDLRWI
jgi:nucleoside-diphosphate-sugar epimerase